MERVHICLPVFYSCPGAESNQPGLKLLIAGLMAVPPKYLLREDGMDVFVYVCN